MHVTNGITNENSPFEKLFLVIYILSVNLSITNILIDLHTEKARKKKKYIFYFIGIFIDKYNISLIEYDI